MARSLTPRDCHALMNLLVKEATGQDATIQVVDSSTFVSAGELVLATGTENVLNSLSIVLGRTIFASRPYSAKLKLMEVPSDLYQTRLRKISFYSKEAQASGDWNTQNATNLAEGYDNGNNGGQSTASMWEQHQTPALEMNFAGVSVWQYPVTIYDNQLKMAFRSESDFAQFVAGIMTEAQNDIEQEKEAFNRMTLVNKIGAVYDLNLAGTVINLTSLFNDEYGTNYTAEQLRTTYIKEFSAFFVEKFKLASDYLTNRSAKYHWTADKTIGADTFKVLRHTPKADQRAFLYSPLFTKVQTQVFSDIFNPQYLDVNNYEGVEYWQNINDPSAVKVTPAIPDTAGTQGGQVAGQTVNLSYVVGILYDKDAMMTCHNFEGAETTPIEARKRYRNVWYSFAKNAINDATENAIIFIM